MHMQWASKLPLWLQEYTAAHYCMKSGLLNCMPYPAPSYGRFSPGGEGPDEVLSLLPPSKLGPGLQNRPKQEASGASRHGKYPAEGDNCQNSIMHRKTSDLPS